MLGDLLHAEGVLHARHLVRMQFGLVRVRADGHSSNELGNRCGSGEEADGKDAKNASTEHAVKCGAEEKLGVFCSGRTKVDRPER